ncbi:hypothetical protein EE612_032182, partial [Oryza sativa]
TCTYLICERKKLANIKKKYFQQHGGMLLLQEIGLKQALPLQYSQQQYSWRQQTSMTKRIS